MNRTNSENQDNMTSLINELIDHSNKYLLNIQITKMLPLLNKLQGLRKYYGHNHSSISDLLNRIGNILKDSPLSQVSIFFFLEQYRIEVYYLGYHHAYLAPTLYNIGHVYAKNNELSEAIYYFTEAYLILSKDTTKRPLYALTIYNIGLVNYRQSLYVDAMEFFNLAIKEERAFFGEFHPDVAEMHLKVGNMQQELGMVNVSMNNFLEALLILRIGGNKNSKVVEILYNIGLIHEVRGEYAEALNAFYQSINIASDLEDDFAVTIVISHKIVLIYQFMGDTDNTIRIFEGIINSLKDKVGNKHICVATVLGLLRNVYTENWMLEKSKNATNEIQDILGNVSEQSPYKRSNDLGDAIIEIFGCIIDDNHPPAAGAA